MSGIYRGVNGSAIADALNIDGDKGDLTVSNSGLEWTINPGAVGFAKIQDIPTDTVLGRATAGTGSVETIICTQAGRALLDDVDASAQRTTLGVVVGTDILAYDANLQSFITVFTLPTTDGLSGYVLTSDGFGNLSLSAPTGVSDGDKGDISVSSGGTVWNIDVGVVTTTELGGDITTAGKALLDDADATAQRTTLGLGTAATTASTDYATASQGALANTAVQPADITNMLETTDIGVTVQGYDVDTAKTDVLQTFTASQRGTVTTDNDLSFDMSVTNNFTCTPTAGGVLTFTNITAGQSGYILLTNNSNYAITAAATTKVGAAFLANISLTGTYLISYFSNGTNVYCTSSGVLA